MCCNPFTWNQLVSQCFKGIIETSLIKRKLANTDYLKQKLSKIKVTAVKTMLSSTVEIIDDRSEIVGQLKEKFHASTDQSQKPNPYSFSQELECMKNSRRICSIST